MRTTHPQKGLFWIESWSPYLEKWCTTTAFFNVYSARSEASRMASTYRRAYRVTIDTPFGGSYRKTELGRFTGER